MTATPRFLITGATHGIGLGVASALAAQGADLHIVGRTPSLLSVRARELTELGAASVTTHTVDLSSVTEVQGLASTLSTLPAFTGVGLLAGALLPEQSQGPEGVDSLYAVNHLHKSVLARALAPQWEKDDTALLIGAAVGVVKGDAAEALESPRWSMMKINNASQHANDLLAVHLQQAHPSLRIVAWNPGSTRGTRLGAELRQPMRLMITLGTRWGRTLADTGKQGADALTSAVPGLTWIKGKAPIDSPAQDSWLHAARELWAYDAALAHGTETDAK